MVSGTTCRFGWCGNSAGNAWLICSGLHFLPTPSPCSILLRRCDVRCNVPCHTHTIWPGNHPWQGLFNEEASLSLSDYKNLFRLDGRKAVIIGGGSGLGRASSIALAQFGADAVVADVNMTGVDETIAAITSSGKSAVGTELNITDAQRVNALAAAHSDTEILVVTPGVNVRKKLLDTTDEEFDRIIDINLKGVY